MLASNNITADFFLGNLVGKSIDVTGNVHAGRNVNADRDVTSRGVVVENLNVD